MSLFGWRPEAPRWAHSPWLALRPRLPTSLRLPLRFPLHLALERALAATLTAALALALAPQAAASSELQAGPLHLRLSGFLLSTSMVGIAPASGALPRSDLALSVLRLRPVAEANLRDAVRLEVGWDVLPVLGQGAFVQRLAVAPPNRLRLRDLDAVRFDGESFDVQHNLDRLLLSTRIGAVDVRIGRQAIGFGGARLLPTADLFGPFGPGSIATEFKRGVDALRLTLPIGDRLEVEAYAVAHRPATEGEAADVGMRDGVYVLRVFASVPDVLDASLLAGISYRRPTLAWALNGDLGGAGVYLEGSARWLDDAKAALGDADGKLQLRATLGADRQWSSDTRTLVEVSWQSTGAKDAEGLLAAFGRLPVAVGDAFLVGRLHAAAMVAQPFWDLHNVQLAAIWNLSDGSGLLMPGVTLSVADNVTLAVGGLLPVGKRPLVGFGGFGLPRSEFGSSPFLAYVDLRLGW